VGVGERDVVLSAVQLFHAAGWGLPYAAALFGSKLVLPGRHLDEASLLELIVQERVSVVAGVPTIWLPILHILDEHPDRYDVKSLKTIICAGSAAPPSMIDGFAKRHAIDVIHSWGMTELNPLGTFARVKRSLKDHSEPAILTARHSQGYAAPLVEMRHVDEEGHVLPWDGATMGELEVRGPFVAGSYYGGEGADKFTADGWFRTGDVVTIDAEGYMKIADRSKDVIKSGGEWISSVALENALMGHPAVMEAAVFAARHPKWDERPVAAIVTKPNARVTPEDLLRHIEPYFARYWMPDRFIFVHQIPRTSTGKFLKSKLRAEYGECLVAEAAAESAGSAG
jgi:fatty-acyl-CoA synthase